MEGLQRIEVTTNGIGVEGHKDNVAVLGRDKLQVGIRLRAGNWFMVDEEAVLEGYLR